MHLLQHTTGAHNTTQRGPVQTARIAEPAQPTELSAVAVLEASPSKAREANSRLGYNNNILVVHILCGQNGHFTTLFSYGDVCILRVSTNLRCILYSRRCLRVCSARLDVVCACTAAPLSRCVPNVGDVRDRTRTRATSRLRCCNGW